MAIELKEVLDFIGVEGETLDDVKSAFNTKWVKSEEINTKIGEINGKAMHALKKSAKALGFDYTSEELKDLSLFDAPELLSNKITARFAELEKENGLTNEQAGEKYKDDISKLTLQLKDSNQLLETSSTDFSAFKVKTETDNRNRVVNTAKNGVIEGLKFSDSVDKFAVIGWKSELDKKFVFEMDGNTQVVRDTKGTLIQSKTTAGTGATFEEVINSDFTESKLGAVVDTKKVVHLSQPVVTHVAQNAGTGLTSRA